MKQDYRNKFYSRYVSTHSGASAGTDIVSSIEGQFPAWKSYFGSFLPSDKLAKILDLGCGDGGFIYWLNSLGFSNACGVDISEEQIELSKKIGATNIKRVDIFEYLRSQSDCFDVVFARDVLEHMNKDEVCEVLELIRHSLKNGGIFVAQTANAENLLWGRIRHGDFTHESAFTERSAKQIFAVSGFKDVSVFPQRPAAHGTISSIRAVLWRIFEVFMRVYLLVETGSSAGIFTQNIIIRGANKTAAD